MHSSSSEPLRIPDSEEQEWRAWTQGLRRFGLAGLASALLESSEVFPFLAAQGLYIGQPLLEPWIPVRSLTNLLEDPQRVRAFAALLQEDSQ